MIKYTNKFISISYFFLTNLYNFFFSKYEEYFLKKNNFLRVLQDFKFKHFNNRC